MLYLRRGWQGDQRARYNQLTAVAGTVGKFTNVTGLLTEPHIDTVVVENVTAETEAARVDLMHGFCAGERGRSSTGRR